MTLQRKKDKQIIDGWRKDPRMVFLANPGRDLTAKERKEWERNIGQCQVGFEPGEFGQIDVVSASLFGM
jgi:hypothetical protein